MEESTQAATTIPERINTKLRAALQSVQEIHITDKSGGCGQSFQVIVVAPEFKDMKLLER